MAIAIFDLDGTITRGDTFIAYLLYVLGQRPARLTHCFALPVTAALFGLRMIGRDEVKRRLLDAVVSGSTRPEIEGYTKGFIKKHVQYDTKPTALERIAFHSKRGDLLVLATASVDLYAQAVGAHLGFDHVLSTRVAWHQERVVYGLEGPNLRGNAKVIAIKQLLDRVEPDDTKIIAYSDHHSDLPLLRYADEGYAVDPTVNLTRATVGSSITTQRWM